MKRNKIWQSLLILTIAFSLIQCKKDNDTPQSSNSIKMGENTFTVAYATIAGVSIGDNGHTGISFMSGNSTQANTLTIDVESFTQATIEGEYAYPEVSDKKSLDDWLTYYTTFEGTTMHSSNLESGEVSIVHNSNDNYTVTMSLKMVDSVTFIGSYTGDFMVTFSNQ